MRRVLYIMRICGVVVIKDVYDKEALQTIKVCVLFLFSKQLFLLVGERERGREGERGGVGPSSDKRFPTSCKPCTLFCGVIQSLSAGSLLNRAFL